MDDRIGETPVMRSSWSQVLVIGGLLAIGYRILIACQPLVGDRAPLPYGKCLFWAFFLDNELMLSLHGAEGLRLCQTTWHEVQEDTGLSIGGTWESPCCILKVFDRRHGASCILCSEEYNYSRLVSASRDLQVG